MGKYENYYKRKNKVPIEQLLQLLRIVWDGDLISKSDRNKLIEMGLINRADGFQVISPAGIKYLLKNGYIGP